MTRRNASGKPRAAGSRPARVPGFRLFGRGPALGVALRFIGITIVLLLISLAPGYQAALNQYTAATARAAAWLCTALGESAHVSGTSVWSQRFSVTVVEGCSAAECAWFVIAGILAVPSSWLLRFLGAALGSLLIAILNVIRVSSLFWIGIRAHAIFRTVHEDAWPLILTVSALLFVALWLNLTAGRRIPAAARDASPDASV